MHAISPLPAAALTLLLGACASPAREPLSQLDALADVELDYEARVAPGTWQPAEQSYAQDPDIDLETVDTFIDVHASFVTLDAEQVDELFDEARYAPWAVTTRGSSAARFLLELEGNLAHEQRLTVAEGQPGHVLLANQIAYIERFEIEHSGNSSVADPVVGVATDGLMLDFVGTLNGEAVGVEIELVQSQLQRPLSQVDVELPGLFMPVTIQQPITSTQTIKLETQLDADEVLMLGIPVAGEAGQFLVGYVSARVLQRVDIAPESFVEDVDAAAAQSAARSGSADER